MARSRISVLRAPGAVVLSAAIAFGCLLGPTPDSRSGPGSTGNQIGRSSAQLTSTLTVTDEHIVARIQLDVLPSELVVAQPWVESGGEYGYFLLIDSDGDPNNHFKGYDVGFGLADAGWYLALDEPDTIPFLDVFPWCYTFWLYYDVWGVAHNFKTHTVDTATNSIVMIGDRSWPELRDVDEGDRFQIRTNYQSEDGWVRDETSDSTVGSPAVDAAGDVAFQFIDIVGGTVSASDPVRSEPTSVSRLKARY